MFAVMLPLVDWHIFIDLSVYYSAFKMLVNAYHRHGITSQNTWMLKQ